MNLSLSIEIINLLIIAKMATEWRKAAALAVILGGQYNANWLPIFPFSACINSSNSKNLQ